MKIKRFNESLNESYFDEKNNITEKIEQFNKKYYKGRTMNGGNISIHSGESQTIQSFVDNPKLLDNVIEFTDGLQYFIDSDLINYANVGSIKTRDRGIEMQYYISFKFDVNSKEELDNYIEYLSEIKLLVNKIDGMEFKMGGINIMYFIFG